MAAILNLIILNLAILDSAILVFPLKLTHICQDWFPPFAQKRLNSHFPPHHLHKKTSLIHSASTWWWQSSWILPCWIQTPWFLLSDSLKNTLTPLWLWLKLIQSDSNSFIFTQLDDGSHLEFCHLEYGHLGFSHLSFSSQTHSHLPRLVPTICTKKPSLIHSDSTWWWQPSWILPCWIKKTSLIHSDSTWWWQPSWILPCWIQTPCFLLSDSLKNTLTPLWLWLKLIQSHLTSFNLTQFHDGSHFKFHHLEFCHLGFSHFVKTLTQTNSIWLKLIHSDSIWWWQPSWILPSWIWPSWILPCWIQTLPSWIQTPSYLLSDSLKNTFPPLRIKLIQSDSKLFILT